MTARRMLFGAGGGPFPLLTVVDLTAAPEGGWCWFNDPRALYDSAIDSVVFGYLDTAGDVRVRTVDDTTRVVSAAIDMYPTFEADDHDNPAFLRRASDGRLLGFWSLHVGDAYCVISDSADDITGMDLDGSHTTNITSQLGALGGGEGYTYLSPVQLTGEAGTPKPIYLFFRFTTATSAFLAYSKSTNNGASWSAKTRLVETTYHHMAQNGTGRIDFAVGNHPSDVADHGIYHCYYEAGNLYQSDGTLIGTVGGGPYVLADLTQVYDGTTDYAWIWDTAIDGTGKPVCVFTVFADTGTWLDHRYYYGRWNGASWDVNQICAAGGGISTATVSGQTLKTYSGGVVLDQNDPNVVYASREVSGQFEMFRYETADGGATFGETQLTSGSAAKQIRPIPVTGASSHIKALWLNGTYTDYLGNYSVGIRAAVRV